MLDKTGVKRRKSLMRDLIVLKGAMRAGKTTFCRALYRELSKTPLRPFAIVEENTRDREGYPLSLFLRDLGSGEGIALASRPRAASRAGSRSRIPFVFSEQAFAWAEAKIKKAVAEGAGPVIIDEIGPLEALDRGGFWDTLPWVMERGEYPLLLTLRPELERPVVDGLKAAIGDFSLRGFVLDSAESQNVSESFFKRIFCHCQEAKSLL